MSDISDFWDLFKADAQDGICPYCKGHSFQNSWGESNAVCASCNREFNIVLEDGRLRGLPISPPELLEQGE